jgi:hypothetical protein
MTIADWLRSRVPPPPAAMSARLIQSLGERAAADTRDTPQACIDSAVSVLARLLAQNPAERDLAFDLLAADALVTYAFEAAAESPARLEEQAADAIVRLAALAESGEPLAPHR